MEYTEEELIRQIDIQSMRIQDEEDMLVYYKNKLEALTNGTTKPKR